LNLQPLQIVVIGGGAAGFFGAIASYAHQTFIDHIGCFNNWWELTLMLV